MTDRLRAKAQLPMRVALAVAALNVASGGGDTQSNPVPATPPVINSDWRGYCQELVASQ